MGKISLNIFKGRADKPVNRRRDLRKQGLVQLGLSLVILILLNIISSFLFTRFDLTSEKRYSLNPATKKILRNLDDVVFFKVYLEGEFPAGFKRLRNETKEMLDEFRAYSDNIQYEFINPSAAKDKKDRNSFYTQLMEKGLQPTNLQVKKEEGTSQQIIFPGALISYKDQEAAVQLLANQINTPPEAVLNVSVQNLEFSLANTIKKLTSPEKQKIAFIEGHGELSATEVFDITNSLKEYYQVDRVTIANQLNSLTERDLSDTNNPRIANKYRCIIIAKPDSAIDEKDKFLIDQYIMRGGRVLWLIDPVFASMDSLQMSNETVGVSQNLNLDDLFFRYGVRLNTNLILDINSCPIPVKTGQIGNQPQLEMYPWFYFPLVMPAIDHPVVNNLNAVKFEFVSSLDTVEAGQIQKTILLTSSRYTRVVNTPAVISLEILRNKPEEKMYRGPGRAVAALLEGKFKSLYLNRIPPEISENKEIGFKENSDSTKMIVISDGDVIKNYIDHKTGYPYPLGFDRYTQETFGNMDFLLNAIDYLCDDSGLITVRSRQIKLRMLDVTRVDKDKFVLQLANTAFPVVLVLLAGYLMMWRRKRIYSRLD
ncbi:MAG: gliding motility-associated ABC transporter substrate-binding protein GldG [Bacteroidales bacterium]